MLGDKLPDSTWFYVRVGGVLALAVVAAMLGLYLGEKSVSITQPGIGQTPGQGTAATTVNGDGTDQPVPVKPFFFFPNAGIEGDWTVSVAEARTAAAAGIHQYVVSVPLPWTPEDGAADRAVERLKALLEADPAARIALYLRLDPPEAWRSAHPETVVTVDGNPQPYVCVAADVWRDGVKTGLDALTEGLREEDLTGSVVGCVLACLEEGQWRHAAGYDTCPANAAAFRVWLESRYTDEASLRAAWADEQAAFATAAIPPRLDTGDTSRVFFDLPAMQPQVDFLEYTSETVADAISSIAAHVKTIMQDQGMVIVPYGYTFELARNDAGHFALGSLLDGTVDAFASPVSRFDRALGGAGSPMGPVDSVRLHGKQWFVMDDTRTGLSRDAATGAIGRLEGLRIEDVYSVQRRNFATVLSHELGLIWTDPEGTGALCDAEMWNRFAAMEKAYEGYQARGAAKSMDPAESWPPPGRMLAVVVDEASRSYQQCDEKLNALILMQAQDAALRSAMPVRFYLLQDLLDDRVPPAAVYLFPNLFYLDENTRLQLHALLRRQQAAAIWLYAPGYIADKPDVANICATTRMTVKAFKEPASSGSKYKLAGAWIDKNEEIGPGITWNPLFYIDDENADVITEYRESGKPSAAITFLDDEWSSIFLAEPFLTPGLLREILRILEQSLCIQEDGGKFFDVTYFNANLFGIHAKESGERMINLGTERAWDVQDLLSPEIGWLQTSGFMLPLRAGETRLLQLTPAAVTAPPAVPAEPAPADAVDDPSGGG